MNATVAVAPCLREHVEEVQGQDVEQLELLVHPGLSRPGNLERRESDQERGNQRKPLVPYPPGEHVHQRNGERTEQHAAQPGGELGLVKQAHRSRDEAGVEQPPLQHTRGPLML